MSMQILTVMQILGIFCAYSIMAFILPALLLYRKIKDRTFTIRFMTYLAVGNFFMICLVLFLQLLHISNRVALTVFSVFIFFALYALLYRVNPGQKLGELFENICKLAEGAIIKKFIVAIWRRFCRNKLDCLLVLVSIAAVLVIHGRNAFFQYSYCASDIDLHNYWINAMGEGQLFVDGVYPFGFRCVIYYLHQVFHIEIFVLLRLFWTVQTLLIHLLLLAFIRMCCKSKYIAYAGLSIYTFAGVFVENTGSRYICSIPQEFGMIFMLPSIAFLFLFFEQKKKELDANMHNTKDNPKEREPQLQVEEEERIYLLDEVLAETAAREASGQTFTMQPRPEYEQPETILTIERNEKDGSLYIKKMPLEIQAEMENGSSDILENIPKAEEEAETADAAWTSKNKEDTIKSGLPQRAVRALKREFSKESSQYLALFTLNFSMTLTVHFYNTLIAAIFCLGVAFGFSFRLFRPQYFGRVICAGVLAVVISVFPMLAAYVCGTPLHGSLQQGMAASYLLDKEVRWVYSIVPVSIVILFILAVLYFILKQTDYAAKMMSTAVYMALMTCIFVVPSLGFPELMDKEGRTCIYYAYSMILVWSFCADGIWNLLFGWNRKKIICNYK